MENRSGGREMSRWESGGWAQEKGKGTGRKYTQYRKLQANDLATFWC